MNELSVNHLLGIKHLNVNDLNLIFKTADNFKDVINRNVEPITNAEDATETLKVALAILDSAANNKIINI